MQISHDFTPLIDDHHFSARNLSSLLELLAGLANGAAAAYVVELLQVNSGRIRPNSTAGFVAFYGARELFHVVLVSRVLFGFLELRAVYSVQSTQKRFKTSPCESWKNPRISTCFFSWKQLPKLCLN